MDLEKKFKFKYLPSLTFESSIEMSRIMKKALILEKKGKIPKKAITLGVSFIKKIESQFIPKVSIRYINKTVGYGLFLDEDLPRNSYFGEYTGIVRKNDHKYTPNSNNYCYEYPIPDYIGRSHVIDAQNGNLTRFINHSFEPNLRPLYAYHKGIYHVIFITLHKIKKGKQLLFNYGINFWYTKNYPQEF